jgi:membrane protease YdiL (CAAX protease family)
MPIPDLLVVLALVALWPLYEHFVDWPAFQRRVREDPQRARAREYVGTMVVQWSMVAIAGGVWLARGRGLLALGLIVPVGWRLVASVVALVLLAWMYLRQVPAVAGSERLRRLVAARMDALHVRDLLPRTRAELWLFLALSVTAGVCEEFLFRGFLLQALAPVLGWWGAAALGVPVFGLLHSMQGREGMLRTAAVGAVLTLVVAATHSLLPAMALHALVDIGSGSLGWVVREAPASPEPARAEVCLEGEPAFIEA